MADLVRLVCWPTPDRLAVNIQVQNLAGQLQAPAAEMVQIDTGYSEYLLIPYLMYQALNLSYWQLPNPGGVQGVTVTGQTIQFRQAPVDILIPEAGTQHRTIAQTFVQNNRFLIGRAFLRNFKVILDGPGGQTCLMLSTSS